MKSIIALLLSAATVMAPVPLLLVWDANDPAENVLAYYILSAPEVSGPWTTVGESTTTNWPVIAIGQRAFYVCVASNVWGVSDFSNILGLPKVANSVNNLRIQRQ